MPNTPLETLKSEILTKRAVVVSGSGVSVALTDNSPAASWTGLIKSGIKKATNFNVTLPQDWEDRVLEEVGYAENNGYITGLLSVAEKVTQALGGQADGTFKEWLREEIGGLRVTSTSGPDLINSIGNLGLPLVTTNYDSLLEESLGFSSSTWQDVAAAQRVIRGASADVLHLHGMWKTPASIIFGSTSYGQLLGNSSAQAIEQILAGNNTLIFIGCGDGLADPNFESLRMWLKATFPSSEARHYLLCLAKEEGELARKYKGERVFPIVYGTTYNDLSSFVANLAPAHNVAIPLVLGTRETIQQRAVEWIHARVRSETVIADHLANVDARSLNDILIPPVLLPVTAEQFAQSLELEKENRPKRCDPKKDVKDHECILVISDITAGLTSSLEWLIAQANSVDASLVPVVVDFRSLGKGPRPLERQVKKELRQAGIFLGPDDPLPRMAIGFDNVASRPEKIISRALEELKDNRIYAFCAIGCHEGVEAEILDLLSSSGKNPVVRYLGKLNQRDATKIAALIEPARAERLATKAMSIAKDECLPRTPLTIGLLVCMLLRGETLLATASPTALLDAWVNLLLGRGDPHDDARFALDSLEKADILAYLAERFVVARAGSLPEQEAIACLEEYFAAVGWKEDPIEVLGNFRARYLLQVSNGQVKFSQSSYLHLFAAKRAKESEAFRKKLYEDMLYFTPIIRHYAALTRNDGDLLGRVEQLLLPSDPTISETNGRNFSAIPGNEFPESSIEDLLGQLSLPANETSPDNERNKNLDAPDEPDDSFDSTDAWLDQVDGGDREPFPLENVEDAPPIMQIMTALALVSNVLRDSELVKDLALKKRVLLRTLLIWGKFVNLLDSDEDFVRLWQKVANELCDLINISEARRSKFVESFSSRAPVLMGWHGVSCTLSSRKLLRSLDACFADSEFRLNPAGSVMGALMGYDIHTPGWPKYFMQVQDEHGKIRAVSDTMRLVAQDAFYHETLANSDTEQLLSFLVSHYSRRVNHRTAADRKHHEARIAQRLRQNQILMRSRHPQLGKKTIKVELEDSSRE